MHRQRARGIAAGHDDAVKKSWIEFRVSDGLDGQHRRDQDLMAPRAQFRAGPFGFRRGRVTSTRMS